MAGLWRDLLEMVPPFFRIVFYLELLWAIFPLNPVESVRIAILDIGKCSAFVRGESACCRNGLSKRDSGLILDDLTVKFSQDWFHSWR